MWQMHAQNHSSRRLHEMPETRKPVAVVAGAGPGNGAALARRFSAAGYAVALLARSRDSVESILAALDGARGYACDVGDAASVQAAFSGIRRDLGDVDVLLYNAGVKRQEKLQRALPDALDMLTVCVEAGLGFDAALAQVARNTTGPLAAEFSRVLQEMQIGKSRSQALRSLTDRTTVPELRSFVSALVQAGELGITIADVLREQAREMRLRRRQRAEEKAQKVPVKILFPLVFCLFPSMFIVIIGPGMISIAHLLFGK